MATNHSNDDLLRNPAVDYDRTDLSTRGILGFLVGLAVAAIFIQLVIWGMFRFLARSPFFAKGHRSPMATVQKAPPEQAAGLDFQNTRNVNVAQFPEPRLQPDDVRDMKNLLDSEQKLLYAEPFLDRDGKVHISITEAMKILEQRGLPQRPAAAAATGAAPMAGAAKASAAVKP